MTASQTHKLTESWKDRNVLRKELRIAVIAYFFNGP